MRLVREQIEKLLGRLCAVDDPFQSRPRATDATGRLCAVDDPGERRA